MAVTPGDAAWVTAAVVLGLLGLLVARRGYRRLQPELRRLRDGPLTVREATTTPGPVELRGGVQVADQYLEAPFTGQPCAVVKWRIQEYVGGRTTRWRTIASGEQSVPFRLLDETGSIRVDPTGAELTLVRDWETEIGREESAEGRIREFLEELDVQPGGDSDLSLGPIPVVTGDRRRYLETRLDVGDDVSVYGLVEGDAEAGGEWGSDRVAATVREADDAPFVVADSPAVPFFRRSTFGPLAILGAGAALALYGARSALSALATVL